MIDKIANNYLEIEIERLGAQLKSIKGSGLEYLWQGDSAFWSGRAYNIFPIVGRLKNGKYLHNGKEYFLGTHGIIRNAELSLKELTTNKAVYYLTATEETKKIYPFDFYYEVAYSLEENKLTVTYLVKNNGNESMYFGLGGHPGFNVPLDNGEFSDYYLEFSEKCSPVSMIFSKKGMRLEKEELYPLIDGTKIKLTHAMFEDDGIYFKNAAKSVTLKSDKSDRSVMVSYPNMPYIAFWSAEHKPSPFVCIEPWQSLPDTDLTGGGEIKDKGDMIKLLENESYESGFVIEISK